MQSHICKVCACLAVTCHLRFWQNDQDLLCATAVTQGWNGYRNRSQHRKLTMEKKILPPLQQGFKPVTFRSWVLRSNHWAIPAPQLVICVTCYVDTIASTEGYNNDTPEPFINTFNKPAYSLQKQCSFYIFLIETGIDPCLRYQDGQEWQQSGPQSPRPHPLSHALRKAIKKIHGVLLCHVMMYHWTNLFCKSLSISKDTVKMIVAVTLKIAKEYFCMMVWLMMMHHHIKFIRSEILSEQAFTAVINLHCDLYLEYSKAIYPQDTPAYE